MLTPDRSEIFWAPKADHDLLNIWMHYASVASSELADCIVAEIMDAADHLKFDPRLGRPRPEFGSTTRSLLCHPYTIFYRITARETDFDQTHEIEVSRVLHDRQNFEVALFEEE